MKEAKSRGAQVDAQQRSLAMVTPLPGVTSQSVVDALRETKTELTNLRGAGGTPVDVLNQYHAWANVAVTRLGRLLRPESLRQLVTTPRYWTLQSLDPSTRLNTLAGFVSLEVEERLRDVEDARQTLEAQVKRWTARDGLLVVPDTNVYLHHDRPFDEITWNEVVPALVEPVHLVVPLLVVDELDGHKRTARNVRVGTGNSEQVRTRARRTLRRLDDLLPNPRGMATLRPNRFPESGQLTVELLLEEPGHVRLPHPDDELVDQALALEGLSGRKVYLVTFDTGMSVRARAAGLQVIKLTDA